MEVEHWRIHFVQHGKQAPSQAMEQQLGMDVKRKPTHECSMGGQTRRRRSALSGVRRPAGVWHLRTPWTTGRTTDHGPIWHE